MNHPSLLSLLLAATLLSECRVHASRLAQRHDFTIQSPLMYPENGDYDPTTGILYLRYVSSYLE